MVDRSIIIYASIAIIFLLLVNQFVGRLLPSNIWKRSEEEEKQKQLRDANMREVFDPAFSDDTPATGRLPLPYLETVAKKIKDAWGFWNDDEAAIFAALTNDAKTLSHVSQISKTYNRLYGDDLLTVLRQGLSRRELQLLWDGIRNKPVGK